MIWFILSNKEITNQSLFAFLPTILFMFICTTNTCKGECTESLKKGEKINTMKRILKQQDLKSWIKRSRRESIEIVFNPCGPIVVEHGDTITIEARLKHYSDEKFTANWQKVEDGVPRNIILDTDSYSGSTYDIRYLKLIINDTDHNDAGYYQIEIKSLTETFTSQQIRVTVHEDSSSSISKVEVNFLRLYVLCQQIGTNAVRILFDRYVSSKDLSAHLAKYRADLNRGNHKLQIQRCSQDQWNTLFQTSPGRVISSGEFDLTLLYLVIRSTIKIVPPTQGWGKKPLTSHTRESDDLERIKQCRNHFVHTNIHQTTDAEFDSLWRELSTAIDRLSKGLLKEETNELLKKIFYKYQKNDILDSINQIKESLRQQKDDIKQIERRVNVIEEARHIPAHIRASQEQQIERWRDEDGNFYNDTSICKAALEMIGSKTHIIFIGSPGSGKTATSQHLALRLEKEGYEKVPVCKPEQILEFVNTEKKQVFLLDDVLGKLCMDKTLYNNIEAHKESIFTRLGKSSKILFTSRKTVYYEAKRLHLYITENVIDFESDKHMMTQEDKSKMLQLHCINKNIKRKVYQEISLELADIMFPLLCKLFSTNAKYQKRGERFFIQPVECLLEEIDKIQAASKFQYAALIICLINDNEVSIDNFPSKDTKEDVYKHCGLNYGTSDISIVDALGEMSDTYLTRSANTYTFIHDSIYEVVAFHYGRQFPVEILKYMPSSFIANKVKVCQQPKGEDDLSIILDTSMYLHLAKRLYKDIQTLELYDVFKNPALKHPQYLTEFIKLLESKPYYDVKDMFLSTQQNYSHLYKKSMSVYDEGRNRRHNLLLNTTYVGMQNLPFDEWMSRNDGFICDIRVISWVVYYGHTEILKYILDKAVKNNVPLADVFGDELEQSRLLTIGCLSNTCSIVELLLEYVRHDCNDCINTFFTNECPLTRKNDHRLCSPAIAACQFGNIDIIELLMRKGANFYENDFGSIPLVSAIHCGLFEVVKYVVTERKGISPTVMQYCLYKAASCGHIELVNLFVQLGAQINTRAEKKTYPVIAASRQGYYNIVKLLVSLGADINCSDKDKDNHLLVAAKEGHSEIVKFLIENCADANSYDIDGNSLLIAVIRFGHQENIVTFLADNGANVHHKNRNGDTALSSATQKGWHDLVDCLLYKHSDENHDIKDLEKSLKIALWNGQMDILQKLLAEKNKRENCSGNRYLLDLLIDLKNDKISCECASLQVSVEHTYLVELSKHWTLLTFIKLCSPDEFSRMLNLGLNPNSCVRECLNYWDECTDSQRSLIEILISKDSRVLYQEEKMFNLLEYEVNIDVMCITRKSDRTDLVYDYDEQDYEYISVIEYARLQSSDDDLSFPWLSAQNSPIPYYFDIPIDDDEILSQVVKYYRRKSVSAQSKRHFDNNKGAHARHRRYTF